jgi:hypothetical protein
MNLVEDESKFSVCFCYLFPSYPSYPSCPSYLSFYCSHCLTHHHYSASNSGSTHRALNKILCHFYLFLSNLFFFIFPPLSGTLHPFYNSYSNSTRTTSATLLFLLYNFQLILSLCCFPSLLLTTPFLFCVYRHGNTRRVSNKGSTILHKTIRELAFQLQLV